MGVLQDDISGDVGSVPRCRTCGSEHVVRDAWACWNPATGLWELENVFDHSTCHQCEGEVTLVWSRQDHPPQIRVRELNDRFRMYGEGKGSIMITIGVQNLGGEFASKAIAAVRTYAEFSDDNDPWGEHDFGAVEIEDHKVFWKIDYYDPSLTIGSENPANEALTYRVLTIMLAGEY